MHDTLTFMLRLAHFPDAIVHLLLLATTNATMHMGRCGRVGEALARLLAGVAHEGLPSIRDGVLCCSGSACLGVLRVPPCRGPGGPFPWAGTPSLPLSFFHL